MREPVAGLELDHMLVLCGSWALRTHIVMDLDPSMEVAWGQFEEGLAEADII